MTRKVKAEQTLKRPGYFVTQSNGTMDRVVAREGLLPDTVEEMDEVIEVIFDLQPIVLSLEIVELNHEELVDLLAQHNALIALLKSPFLK